ncbi:hypothetical protein K400107F7_29890 [Agathobaculum massiliense]
MSNVWLYDVSNTYVSPRYAVCPPGWRALYLTTVALLFDDGKRIGAGFMEDGDVTGLTAHIILSRFT